MQRLLFAVVLVIALIAAPASGRKCDVMVQGAVDSELQPLLSALKGKEEIQIHSWTFWQDNIGNKSVVISRTGMGPANAAASTAIQLWSQAPCGQSTAAAK